jgi:microcystin degradation protein MlrC
VTFSVLTAEVSHETNTFSIVPTDYRAFTDRHFLIGEAAIAARANGNTDLAGFLDIARERDWRITHTLSAAAPPAGRVTRDAFDRITQPVLAAAQAQRSTLNGILLGLHGSMVTDFDEDGEGELLARLRAVVGAGIPIAITLDPHANVTARMTALADIIVSYKTYPHVDIRETGRQAAEILHRAMAGAIRPKTIRAHRPMLEEINGGRTDVGPMIERMAKARAYEERPGVFAVSVNGGFGLADIAEVGPTVLVTAEGDMSRHQRFAEAIADDIWDRRFEMINDYLSVTDAAATCAAHDGMGGPIIVADYADNPGGGAYGDATNLLQAMLEAKVNNACFGALIDAEAVRDLGRYPVGSTVSVRLGGKTDPRFGGGPLTLSGTLRLLSDGHYVGDGPMYGGLAKSFGATAVVAVEGIEILIVSLSSQILDLQQFRAFGIDPAQKRIVALKSMQHFRAAFEPIAARIIVCDSGALGTPDLATLPFKNVRRPMFPLDQCFDEKARRTHI